jgi:hypothetical protein
VNGLRRAVIVATAASLAVAATAAAHDSGPHTAISRGAHRAVKLRECWLTVAYVPRPAATLRRAFARPPDLGQTFYGPDPLLGVWGISCERGQMTGTRLGPLVLSLVGVPVSLTAAGAPPLANFLAHALIRVDTSSRRLAVGLRRAGLPARRTGAARYRHSPPGAVPFRGALEIPGRYRLAVSASAPDPTNPHQHSNLFTYRGPSGRRAQLGLATDTAFDRFCFPDTGGCSATVAAPPGSAFERLLGGTAAEARVGFEHAKVKRLDISTHRPSTERQR